MQRFCGLIFNKTMQRFYGLRAKALTLFGLAYVGVSGIYLWVGWGKGSNFFLKMTCLGMIYHIQKDS